MLLIIVCTVVTNRIVEPRLGKYKGDAPVDENKGMSPEESKGLRYALFAGLGFLAVLLLLTLPPGAALRNPQTGAIVGNSPFMDSLVFIIMAGFFITGLAYGLGAKTITKSRDAIAAIERTFSISGRCSSSFSSSPSSSPTSTTATSEPSWR